MRKAIAIGFSVIGLIIGYFTGFYVRIGRPWSEHATIFFIITLAGAFGGILYAARDSGVELPHQDRENHRIKLGWLADCGYGIAGAYVVFLILPTDLATTSTANAASLFNADAYLRLIKLIAMALVGGYGGRSLIDRALSNIAKSAEEAKKKAEEAQEVASQATEKLDQMQEIDTEALGLLSRHLDGEEGLENTDHLKKIIQNASRAARFEIFKDARAFRQSTWKKGDKSQMELAIPIFEALIKNNAGEQFHRNHAQLAYILKDKQKPDWERAFQELSTAIQLRDAEGAQGFVIYEFNRALCGIALEKEAQIIISDLKSAAQHHKWNKILKEENSITSWSLENKVDLDDLKGTDESALDAV